MADRGRLRFSSRRVNAAQHRDRPARGFSDAEIARFENLTPLLALVLEVKETQRFASTPARYLSGS